MLKSNDPRMSASRLFGHVNKDTYSPQEYVEILSPIIAEKLREGNIRVMNSCLEPDNNGARLTLLCNKTFSVKPMRGVASASDVLYEHGRDKQSDFDRDIRELFGLAEKLNSITVNDTIGNSYTFYRKDNPHIISEEGLMDLDLTPFDSIGLNESLSVDAQKMEVAGWWVPLSGSREERKLVLRLLSKNYRYEDSLEEYMEDSRYIWLRIKRSSKSECASEAIAILKRTGAFLETMEVKSPQKSVTEKLQNKIVENDYKLQSPNYYRRKFDGSNALFQACWKEYTRLLRGSIDSPTDDDDVNNWLEQIASEKVNNPRSRFYIYGQ